MTAPKNAIYKWLKIATPAQIKQLAKEAKTSANHLRHLAAGRRRSEAGLAIRLATASHKLGHRALYLDQRQICDACEVCPLIDHPKVAKAKKSKPANVK